MTRWPRVPALFLAVALVAPLAGCGEEASSTAMPPRSERVPITQRAIAAIALAHLSDDTTHRQASHTDEQDPRGMLGADLSYGGGGEYDGDQVQVVLSPEPEPSDCEPGDDRCVELPTDVEGARLELVWEEVAPEEDPGVVAVVLTRRREQARIVTSGPEITGDPREMDLAPSVDAMVAVLEDPRLRLLTSPAAVELGEELDDWSGQEPDPAAYDEVANTDHGIAFAYLGMRGGYGSYRGIVRSPLVEDFGAGAIGGRILRRAQYGDPAVDIDVLAAPEPPDWMTGDPCASERFGDRCRRFDGRLGPLAFAWRPASPGDPGEVWMVSVREDEVVAVRFSGPPVPETAYDAQVLFEWFLVRDQIDAGFGVDETPAADDLSLRCDRENLEFDAVPVLD